MSRTSNTEQKAFARALTFFVVTATIEIYPAYADTNMFYEWWHKTNESELMQWRETGRYRAEDESTVRVMVKLNNSYWDKEAEKKRVQFELKLEGKDKAEYKGDYFCRNDGRGVSRIKESESNISNNFRERHMHHAIMLTLYRYCNLHGISTHGES